MCLNITGQRESDGEKLNRSIGYSSFRKPWLVSCSYSFRNKTCEKPQLRGENETMCGVGKTPSDVSVRNIILIFKNKTIYKVCYIEVPQCFPNLQLFFVG